MKRRRSRQGTLYFIVNSITQRWCAFISAVRTAHTIVCSSIMVRRQRLPAIVDARYSTSSRFCGNVMSEAAAPEQSPLSAGGQGAMSFKETVDYLPSSCRMWAYVWLMLVSSTSSTGRSCVLARLKRRKKTLRDVVSHFGRAVPWDNLRLNAKGFVVQSNDLIECSASGSTDSQCEMGNCVDCNDSIAQPSRLFRCSVPPGRFRWGGMGWKCWLPRRGCVNKVVIHEIRTKIHDLKERNWAHGIGKQTLGSSFRLRLWHLY